MVAGDGGWNGRAIYLKEIGRGEDGAGYEGAGSDFVAGVVVNANDVAVGAGTMSIGGGGGAGGRHNSEI